MDKAERILIIAPVGDDDDAIAALLGDEGLVTRVCQGIEEVYPPDYRGLRRAAAYRGSVRVATTSGSPPSPQGAANLVGIACNCLNQRWRIPPGEIARSCRGRRRHDHFAGAADQYPHACPLRAGRTPFASPTVPGARFARGTKELEPKPGAARS